MSFPSEVDVIICGGGAAGSVVAGRLAMADPSLSILVVEGGKNNHNVREVVRPALFLTHLAPTSTTAKFYKGKASEQLNGREPIVPVANILGGGSSINFMMYTRASRSDYDDWKTEGWTAEDLIPLLKKTETHHLENKDPAIHGFEGPLHVSHGGHESDTTEQLLEAAKSMGYKITEDLQDLNESNAFEKWGKWINPETGRRSDAPHGFIHPQIAKGCNLHLLCDTKVVRVIIENGKAVGVEVVPAEAPTGSSAPLTIIKAKKLVVVSSGALGTPQILERSGIGAPEVLKAAGIKQVVDLPGVGTNYQDHNLIIPAYHVAPETITHDDFRRGSADVLEQGEKDFADGKGIYATNFINAGGKVRPTEKEVEEMGPEFQKFYDEYYRDAPDKPVMFICIGNSFLGNHNLVPPGKYVTIATYLEYPASRGTIHVTSPSPYEEPDFDPGYLTHEADIGPNVWGYKLGRELIRRTPCYRGELPAVHPKFDPTSAARAREIDVGEALEPAQTGGDIENLVYTEEDNRAIEEWVRETLATTWHSIGTCAMKPREEGGVVDSKLDVYGVEGLKLADLSICPGNVGANTYSTALVVGEKAAVLIGEYLGLKNV
ncbi:GMC oxidoreductase-domain-containing protein [Tuber borchii]|uniref:GMC oxidoreductase-domain-containing protein n=1 Tax=Tuber borchii TaxID=42251 RepID=A0A2T6ZBG1_TUBBO|nr:GMC oxidoreductase-domain-containing protein [Tuber borchii]